MNEESLQSHDKGTNPCDNVAFDMVDDDDVDPPMMNLSFCGCGFLGIYQLGVATCLVRHGAGFLNKVERIAGASAGSLIGAVLSIDKNLIHDCVKFTYDLALEVQNQPFGALTPKYNLLQSLEKFLNEKLPHNAHEVASGKLFVSVTNLETRRNETMSHFSSRQELVQCLLASSYIPVYAGFNPPVIRGKKYLDGGWTNNLPVFPEGRTVSVSPFAGWQDICPADNFGRGIFLTWNKQTFQVNRKNLRRIHEALFPPSHEILKRYFFKGQKDTERFLIKEGCYEGFKQVTMPPKIEYETCV